jgi:NADH:ubiquinone oxidoreductase subunit 5 (subunit L)/multisubunit Na+/H+ antiporter MnhA subunit
LLSFLFSICFGFIYGNNVSVYITNFFILVCFVFSAFSFYRFTITGISWFLDLGSWVETGLFLISWGFLFDSLTLSMLIVITSVSFCVHMYSAGYMSKDPSLCRFMSYLSLFTFFMLILVASDNFIVLFLGWEGVGLCSYLLISFWYTRISANKAALKAMIVNRVGDCSFSLGIFCIYYVFRTFDFHTVFTLSPYFLNTKIFFFCFLVDTLTLICILLFIGSVAKSAQVGLHTWLPDAMEGERYLN